MADLEKAVELAPNDISVHLERGRVHVLIGNFQQGIDDSGRAFVTESSAEQVTFALLTRALAFEGLGDVRAAGIELEQAILIYSDSQIELLGIAQLEQAQPFFSDSALLALVAAALREFRSG